MFEEWGMECPLRSSISVLWQQGRVLSTCQDDNLDDEQSEEPRCSRGEDVRPSSWSPATSGAPGDISPGPDITLPVTNITMPTWLWFMRETLQHWGLKSNIINRGSVRCFLIISVTIMNCFNAVNVVLVSWDQLQVGSTLETNQWSSVAWSWWRRPSSVWHAAQTTGHWSILRKLSQELIPNMFTSGWPQFVIKSDVN